MPADVLLLSGTCIVNEAMLTGESVPQVKEPAPHAAAAGDTLALVPNPKLHVLFRGTEVVQVCDP
jgi:P-type E1-E2 ATPase